MVERKCTQKVKAPYEKVANSQYQKVSVLKAASRLPNNEKYHVCKVDAEQFYYYMEEEVIVKANQIKQDNYGYPDH